MNRFLKRGLFAGSAVFCGAIIVGAHQASADDGGTPADTGQAQELVLDNSAPQDGTAGITNTQINLNLPVAVLSPGANSGPVEQSNTATNNAAVTNTNSTEQSAGQVQAADATATGGDASGGGDGGDAAATVDQGQTADLTNSTTQSGDAQVENRQINVNVPVAVLSPGANSGPVEQSNTANNNAAVTNTNATEQSAAQSQDADATATGGNASGGGDGGDATATVEQAQTANESNTTNQGGTASVDNTQDNVNKPSAPAPAGNAANSCHGGCPAPEPAPAGPVDQSNTATNSATVSNANETIQEVEQSQDADATATGGNADSGSDSHHGCGCPDDHKGGGSDGGDATATVDQTQTAHESNTTNQGGTATVDNTQDNVNEPSSKAPAPSKSPWPDHGCGCPRPAPSGAVDQSNEANNNAAVTNGNYTDQFVYQGQGADATATGGSANGNGNGGDATATVVQDQVADEANTTSQDGSASVDNMQGNLNAPQAETPAKQSGNGHGCGCPQPAPWTAGDVEQSNTATNNAAVDNSNETIQGVGQVQEAAATATGGDATGKGGDDHHCGCPDKHRGANGGDAVASIVQDQALNVANGTSQGGSAPIYNIQDNVNEPSSKSPSKPDKDRGHGCGCPRPAPWTPGDLEQSNKATNNAMVDNSNETIQAVGQVQAAEATATGGDAKGKGGDDPRCGCPDDHNGDGKHHDRDGKGYDRGGKHHKGGDHEGDDKHNGDGDHKGGGKPPCGCPKPWPGADGGDATAIVDQSQVAKVANRTDQGGNANVTNDQRNRNSARWLGELRQSNWSANGAGVSNDNDTKQAGGQGQLARALANAM